MRYIVLVLLLLSSGCSCLIARSGKDLRPLKTKQQIHEEFGEPVASGISDGKPYEVFHTRQKISEHLRASSLGMGFGMSFGLVELVQFPYELYLQGHKTAFGQTIQVNYDSEGNVSRLWLDGWPLYMPEPPTLEELSAIENASVEASDKSTDEDQSNAEMLTQDQK